MKLVLQTALVIYAYKMTENALTDVRIQLGATRAMSLVLQIAETNCVYNWTVCALKAAQTERHGEECVRRCAQNDAQVDSVVT